MPAITKQITSYRLYYQTAPQYSWQANVLLGDLSNYWVASILFIKEGRPIPENAAPFGRPRLHFPISAFKEVMDILRYEKPLFVTLVTENGIGTISTSDEPVGEEEGGGGD